MTIKPGYKTTEALGTLAVAAGELVAALTGHLSPHWAAIASTVSVGLYALSRAITKYGALTGPRTVTAPAAAAAPLAVAPPPPAQV